MLTLVLKFGQLNKLFHENYFSYPFDDSFTPSTAKNAFFKIKGKVVGSGPEQQIAKTENGEQREEIIAIESDHLKPLIIEGKKYLVELFKDESILDFEKLQELPFVTNTIRTKRYTQAETKKLLSEYTSPELGASRTYTIEQVKNHMLAINKMASATKIIITGDLSKLDDPGLNSASKEITIEDVPSGTETQALTNGKEASTIRISFTDFYRLFSECPFITDYLAFLDFECRDLMEYIKKMNIEFSSNLRKNGIFVVKPGNNPQETLKKVEIRYSEVCFFHKKLSFTMKKIETTLKSILNPKKGDVKEIIVDLLLLIEDKIDKYIQDEKACRSAEEGQVNKIENRLNRVEKLMAKKCVSDMIVDATERLKIQPDKTTLKKKIDKMKRGVFSVQTPSLENTNMEDDNIQVYNEDEPLAKKSRKK